MQAHVLDRRAIFVHGAAYRKHAGGRVLVGSAGDVEVVTAVGPLGRIVIHILLRAKGIGTDGGHHAPGGHFYAVKGQGHKQAEHVHIVHVILFVVFAVASVIPAGEIVVERTCPECGEAHIFIKLVAGHHGGHIVIVHIGAGGKAGQSHALNAHAHLQVGLGYHPVDIGVLHLYNVVAVSAQRTAVRGIAPALTADFKEDCAGQGFRSHGIQLQAHALHGIELVFILALLGGLIVTGHAVAAGEPSVLAKSICLS